MLLLLLLLFVLIEPVAKADNANEKPTTDTLVIQHQRSSTVALQQHIGIKTKEKNTLGLDDKQDID